MDSRILPQPDECRIPNCTEPALAGPNSLCAKHELRHQRVKRHRLEHPEETAEQSRYADILRRLTDGRIPPVLARWSNADGSYDDWLFTSGSGKQLPVDSTLLRQTTIIDLRPELSDPVKAGCDWKDLRKAYGGKHFPSNSLPRNLTIYGLEPWLSHWLNGARRYWVSGVLDVSPDALVDTESGVIAGVTLVIPSKGDLSGPNPAGAGLEGKFATFLSNAWSIAINSGR